MSLYLERAALHQTRFRTPGISPDARSVVVGHRGVLLFPSLDRVVAFFRAFGEGGSLDEILPTLTIRRVVTPLRTREVLVFCAAESSYRMDRIASLARLASGFVFTGSSRHYVKYRDATSPLGYDVTELVDQEADAIVYEASFRQLYAFERELPFRDLVLQLESQRAPLGPARAAWPRLWATAEVGIGAALIGYLFRWQVRARVALAEWPAESAFDEGPRRLHVFELLEVAPRIVELLRTLPGVQVFEPAGPHVGVELGFRHPIALGSCASLFTSGLTLFPGRGTPWIVDPLPPLSPVGSLVRATLSVETSAKSPVGRPLEAAEPMTLDLRILPSTAPWRRVVATVVPAAEREHLAKLLYLLPPGTLDALRVAIADDAVYLLDPSGIEGVPVGRFYSEAAPGIYVPAGTSLVPAVAPGVLEEIVDRQGAHVFFSGDGSPPRRIPDAAFGPVARRALRELGTQRVHAEAPDRADPPLPRLEYGPESRFPLWGVPGRQEQAGEKEEEA